MPRLAVFGGRRAALVVALIALLVGAALLRCLWLDRYPPGWHHDEALMGVMAGEVYRGESRPVFFPQYLGQEPLYIYLSAGMMALLGRDQDPLPLRLTSALVGLLTVGLTFVLGRALFGTRVGLLAMGLMTTSFWQVMSSRNGYRSITQPLLEALAAWALWRARQTGRWGWFALAGAALGATLYTYLGARAFPGVFLGFGLWCLWRGERPSRRTLVRVGLLTLLAVLVAAPLGFFFLTHPGTFSARMEQVFIFRPEVNRGDPWGLLGESTSKLLRSFTLSGEPLWRYNIPGRPMFVGAVALAFYGGLLVLLRRVWRGDPAGGLVLVWLLVMLFPSLLSWEVGAYTLRAMGLVPAVYLVPALGLAAFWGWLERWRAWGARLAPVLLGLLLVVDGVWTARDYFWGWAPRFGAYAEGHADAVAQARFLVQQAQPDREEVFVGSEYYHHPTLAHLARPVYPFLRWFDGRQSVVFPLGSERPVLYVLAFNALPADLDTLFPPSARVAQALFPEGVDGGAPPPLFVAYRFTPAALRAQVETLQRGPWQPVAGQIADLIEPLGAQLPAVVAPGDDLSVVLLWRVRQAPPPGDYQMLVHLTDHRWQKVAGVDALGYPPAEWRPGDVVWSRFHLRVPPETPPGLYRLQAALYDRRTGQRLPVVGGQPGIQALILGGLRVRTLTPPPPPTVRLDQRLGDGVTLLGYDLETAGPRLTVTLHWRADRPLGRDYTVFVQVLDPAGRVVAQSDSQPAAGALPTSAWLPGEIVRDRHVLTLPTIPPGGTYRLIAGLYLLTTGERLPVVGGGDFVLLRTLG